jgi:hypothetical protein
MDSSPIVSVRLWGGLCNNLFQIGAIMGYAEKYCCKYRIYENLFDSSQHTTKAETLNIIAKLFPNLYIDPSTEISEKSFNQIIEINGDDTAKYIELQSPHKDSQLILLKGYFQSEKYFPKIQVFLDNFESVVNQYIISRSIISRSINSRSINSRSINLNILDSSTSDTNNSDTNSDTNNLAVYFIHIRMGDYLGHYLLYLGYKTYLTNAIKYIIELNNKKNKKTRFLICSNETNKEKIKEEMGDLLLLMNNYIFEYDYNKSLDPLITLVNMSVCDGGICMNSSFSWFGAYLCNLMKKNSANIVMPSKWFNESFIPYYRYKDIYPLTWSNLQIIKI